MGGVGLMNVMFVSNKTPALCNIYSTYCTLRMFNIVWATVFYNRR